MLKSTFLRLAEDIRLNGFLVKILASLTVGAVASLVILLAGLGLVLDVSQDLGLKFVSAVSKTTLVTKLALASEFPVLAHLSLVLSLVILDKKASLFMAGKVLALGLNINFKVSTFTAIYRTGASSRRVSLYAEVYFVD